MLKKLNFTPLTLDIDALFVKNATRPEQEAMNDCFSRTVDHQKQRTNHDIALSVATNIARNQANDQQDTDMGRQQIRQEVGTLPIVTHPDKVLRTWYETTVTEIQAISACIKTHARRLWYFANSKPTPSPLRDAEFRNVLRPLPEVTSLKQELKKVKKVRGLMILKP